MAFDPKKDKTLWEDSLEGDTSTIHLQLKQYDEGAIKVQIGRTAVNKKDETVHVKLGRLTLKEFTWVASKSEEILNQF